MIQRCVHSDLKYARVNQIADWERHQNHEDRNHSHKKALQMVPYEAEDKDSAENCESYIPVHHFLELDIEEEATEDSCFDLRVTAI